LTFRIFVNSTTADASDTNDNYYHIGQSSRLPMGGSLLANTTGVYDLGSSSYKWEEFNVNSCTYDTLDANGITWEYLTRTVVDTAASEIEFSGLDSADAIEYLCIFKFISDTSTAAIIGFHANDSTYTAFAGVCLLGTPTTGAAYTITAASLGNTTAPTITSLYTFGFLRFHCDSNTFQGFHFLSMSGAGETYVDRLGDGFGYLSSTTAATVTSLTFVISSGNFQTGTYIELWARGA